jgi:Domain of unknown function (DUF222)
MDSNTHSASSPDRLPALAADLQSLDGQPLDGQPDAARADRVMALQGLADRLQGHWLAGLADVDARGAAGAEQGLPAGSTAGWLRARLRMGAGTAASLVRTARARYRGPLTATGQALSAGAISAAHAQVLAAGTQELAAQVAAEAEPVLLAAARRLDPPRLRQAIAHLRLVADPDATDTQAERRHQRRGLWLASTWRAWSPSRGCWRPRPARPWWPPWSRWPARPAPTMPARVASAAPMPWSSWPAAPWRAASSLWAVGCGPSCWSPWI